MKNEKNLKLKWILQKNGIHFKPNWKNQNIFIFI